MADIRLAIVGGGPKAAALCAKIACLQKLNVPISADVFERAVPGAHWSGENGYTDGRQALCTPADRDLGFPYGTALGPMVQREMLADYSWPAHLMRNGGLARWVGDGRHPPSHGQFAAYVAAAIHRSGQTPVTAEVTGLRRRDGTWTVQYRDEDGADALGGYTGVVITGSGPPHPAMGADLNPNRVYDGQTFWTYRNDVRRRIDPADPDAIDGDLVIIGAGGTAAAIAGWLVRAGVRAPIRIVGNQPALYARADSAFENRMFESSEVWEGLSFLKRREFSERLTRGTVWQMVIDDLGRAENVFYMPGEARRVELEDPTDTGGPLQVFYTRAKMREEAPLAGNEPPSIPAAVVIDARGFDGWWFRRWLTEGLRNQIETDRERMERDMSSSLALPLGGAAPNLHVPGKSWFVHPGYASLMSLGDMADAILKPYVRPYLDDNAPLTDL